MASNRTELTQAIESVLRNRTYDEHPEDEDLFEELLDDIDVLVQRSQNEETRGKDPAGEA